MAAHSAGTIRSSVGSQPGSRWSPRTGRRILQPLDFVGTCADPVDCEHALHVVGGGSGFVLRDSRLVDFDAQIKVNTSLVENGPPRTPHGGLIERCDFHDTADRSDATPVTKINIDTGDDWIVRDNRIADAAKESDASYAAFMKSGGHGGLFERNSARSLRLDPKVERDGPSRLPASRWLRSTSKLAVGRPCDGLPPKMATVAS